jgi:cardiolipin synthase
VIAVAEARIPTTADADAAPLPNLIWTVPNGLSFLRLLGVPVFLWLILGPHADGWAIALLMVSGATDYLDGKLARMWNQQSRLGQLLDPAADRLYVLSTLIALTIRHVLPLWLTVALIARDVLLAALIPALDRIGYGPLPVSYLGKSATANLLYAFPLLLLGAGHSEFAHVIRPFAWGFALWGAALYWWAALLYIEQYRRLRLEHQREATA